MTDPPEDKIPGIHEYAGKVLAARIDRMLSHAEGVRGGEEIEDVHQMRVWSRRARAALDVFGACFPVKEYRHVQREVKAVTSALGEVRDLDVMIGTLVKRAAALPVGQRAGVEGFIMQLRERRAAGQREVAKAMGHLDRSDLPRRLDAMLNHGLRGLAHEDNAGGSL